VCTYASHNMYSMYIYICVCVCVCFVVSGLLIRTRTITHSHTRTHYSLTIICIYTGIYIYICVCMCLYVFFLYVFVYVCMCLYVFLVVLFCQDYEAMTPNLLARTVETVEGGGTGGGVTAHDEVPYTTIHYEYGECVSVCVCVCAWVWVWVWVVDGGELVVLYTTPLILLQSLSLNHFPITHFFTQSSLRMSTRGCGRKPTKTWSPDSMSGSCCLSLRASSVWCWTMSSTYCPSQHMRGTFRRCPYLQRCVCVCAYVHMSMYVCVCVCACTL